MLDFLKKKPKVVRKLIPSIVWDINNFNRWFCEKYNGATYAHRGIWGRTDKLSWNHITEYLEIVYGLSPKDVPEISIIHFMNDVRESWRNII